MRAHRASKRPPPHKKKSQAQSQPRAIKPRKKKPKAPQNFQRVPQQVVKDHEHSLNHLMLRHYLIIQWLHIYTSLNRFMHI
jgi:hypothetical protein